MARKKAPAETKVESIRHKDKRTNIPTEELRDFIADDEQAPKTMLYPRDPSLDPQLVWRGKDEQDRQDLAVPVVPIYIQEKIHPQAIIDDLMVQRKSKPGEQQLSLFNDFNGIDDFDKKIDFYHHAQHWSNRMILGDSLLVMTSLAEKEGLKGKVQTIYFDPPYGIKFGSNWQVSTRKREVKDGKFEDATRQPEQIRAFRDTWKLGIHSYLAYLRDRLNVARELLTETGSLFVQIGDENYHLVRSLMDEVYGSANMCATITFAKTSSASSERLGGVCDYLIWYAKNLEVMKYRQLYHEKELSESTEGSYDCVETPDGKWRRMSGLEKADPTLVPKGCRILMAGAITSSRPPGSFPVKYEGKTYTPSSGYWKSGEAGFLKLADAKRLMDVNGKLRYRRYFDDFPVSPITNNDRNEG